MNVTINGVEKEVSVEEMAIRRFVLNADSL